ncbi:MAG TPA: 50S ribosomal protein L29 [Armatimonadetes bacterium]|jgi:large subunit ribosomal protein L29|nr:50S ribosomal protein L29 [Armatimonadota bacterium]HHX39027.1 50S ribosomal protein L29 [Armatimonadota bacterium]HOM82989.1 50S ribosomal protein L29 [Armatimonadota bacterium]HOQ29322.1 50S ribosomal protein L29 [Armatimonadota bacterium]HPO72097.1 50S ribosomal protein L29 [Armatimonadota bacterium]
MSNKSIRALREKSDVELEQALQSAREALYRHRSDQALRRLEDPNAISKRRKEIARILTLQRERQLAKEQS